MQQTAKSNHRRTDCAASFLRSDYAAELKSAIMRVNFPSPWQYAHGLARGRCGSNVTYPNPRQCMQLIDCSFRLMGLGLPGVPPVGLLFASSGLWAGTRMCLVDEGSLAALSTLRQCSQTTVAAPAGICFRLPGHRFVGFDASIRYAPFTGPLIEPKTATHAVEDPARVLTEATQAVNENGLPGGKPLNSLVAGQGEPATFGL